MSASDDSKQHRPVRGGSLALVLLIVALWGGNAVAVSFSIDALPPIAVAAIRFAMATVVIFVWCLRERTALVPSREECWLSLIAGTLLFLQIGTFNVGVMLSNSTHGVMLVNTFVFGVAALEHFWLKTERFTTRRSAGLAAAAVGVAMVVLTHDASDGPSRELFLVGDAILTLSAVLLAVRIVFVRSAVQKMAPSKLMLWHDVVAVALFVCWSACTESFEHTRLTWPAFWGLLYQGVIVGGVCFLIHANLLRSHSASQISVFSFATPIFGVFFSVLLRGEPLTLFVCLGAACVAWGIYLVTVE